MGMELESIESLSRRAADLYRAGRHEEALEICLSLADSSQAPSWILWLIGTMHLLGHGTKLNRKEGLSWYRRAADAGDPRALTFFARHEQTAGRYLAAKALLEEAASQGHLPAVIQLGYLYDRGLGVSRDPKRAREYFEQGASEGYVFAKRFIAGQMLRGEDGLLGIPKGMVMLFKGFVDILHLRIRDPESDKGRL
jgi:TPR repeat protein